MQGCEAWEWISFEQVENWLPGAVAGLGIISCYLGNGQGGVAGRPPHLIMGSRYGSDRHTIYC